MDESLGSEVYQPTHIYEIKFEKIFVIAVLEDLLYEGFELCHHNNPNIFLIFKSYGIKIKSKAGRPQKYKDPKERYKVHYQKKKREQQEKLEEILHLKEEIKKLKQEKQT